MSDSHEFSYGSEEIPNIVDPESPKSDQKVQIHVNPKELSAKAIYSNIKKKVVRSPSFNNSSDFIEDSPTLNSVIPSESLQLARITDDGIELCADTLTYLKKIKEKIGIVSIGGPARTGKSLLMNLLTKQNTFEVGSRVQACTQGIWITPLQTQEKLILLIDSEGCKSVEKSGSFDAKLFALLILISSVFVYNSKGVIDEQSISQLALATHLSEMISFNLHEEEDDEIVKSRVTALAPKFVWVLRDFHLSLVDQDDNSITSKQYMENILNMKKYYGRNAEKNSQIRERFLEMFQDRSCVTLPRPADLESELEHLNSIPLESLRAKFIKAFKSLEKLVIDLCPVKLFHEIEINGQHLVTLLEEIIKCLNQGIMPNIHTVWNEVIRKQYELFLEEAKLLYNDSRSISIESMPYEESELIFKLQHAKDLALQGLRDMQQKDPICEEQAIEEFEIFFQEDLKFTMDSNVSASEAFNLALIERIFRGVIKKLDCGQYKDNFTIFETEWISCMREYENQSKGPGKLLAITEFSKKRQHAAYSKFFQNTAEGYEQEIKDLREKQKEYQNILYEKYKEKKDLIVDEHVRNI